MHTIDFNMPDTHDGCAAYTSGVLDALEPMLFNDGMSYADRVCRILMMRHMAKAVLDIGWFEHTCDFDPFWIIRRLNDDGLDVPVELPHDDCTAFTTIIIDGFIDNDTIDCEAHVTRVIAYCDDEAETPVHIPIDKITYLAYCRC